MTTALSFVFFTALVAVVAWWKTHNDDQETSAGYFLAGRSLSWIVVGGSLLLTNLSTEQLVGLNGGAYKNGMIVMAWEVWSALAIVAMAVIFLPRYLKSGITTIPQYLELRFSSTTRQLTSIIFLASIVLNVLPFVLMSGAKFMITVFDVPSLTGTDNVDFNMALVSTLLAVVGGCYAIFGGLKAVAVSDTVNGIGLIVGGLLIPFLGLSYIGDGNIGAGLSALIRQHPQRLSSIGDTASDIPWPTLLTGMTMIVTYYWCTNQGIVQRTLASKNLAEGQKGVLFAALMKLAGPLYLVLPGIIAWHIVSSGQAAAPANNDEAYGFLVNLVLPKWAVGFFAATIFGAILSSFNSFLNSGSTLFSLDLYKGFLNRDASEKQQVKVGKLIGVVMIPVTVGLAVFFNRLASVDGLFNLMKNIAAVLNIPLLAIVVMGIISRTAPARAANIALAAGMLFQGFFGVAMDNVIGIRSGDAVHGLQMHWLHLAAVNFVFLLILMAIITKLSPRSEPFEQQYTEDVDITPWTLAKPAGAALVILIAAMYAGMWARFGVTPGEQLTAEYERMHPSAAATVVVPAATVGASESSAE
ncbi:MAG: solute:sodium symporter family transporter [Planctomycetaceae bacterium]